MRVRRGELSASTAVLGLLVEQADSVAGLTRRLPERFPQGRFSRNAAHKALPSLLKQDLASVVARGRVPSLDVYEATEHGHRSYRESLRLSASGLPAVPDALSAWLEEVGDEAELSEFIGVVEQLEAACLAEFASARKEFKASGSLRALARREEGWRDRTRRTLMEDRVVVWLWWARRLQRMREGLEFDVDLDETADHEDQA